MEVGHYSEPNFWCSHFQALQSHMWCFLREIQECAQHFSSWKPSQKACIL